MCEGGEGEGWGDLFLYSDQEFNTPPPPSPVSVIEGNVVCVKLARA